MDGQAAAADDPSLAAAGLLETFGFSGEALDKLVESATEKAQEVGQTLLSAVVSTVLRSVAYAVVYLVSFLLLLLLLRLLLAPLHLFTKLPVVHGINAVMGGALGLVKGALLLFFAVWLLRRLQIWMTPELISQTYILPLFCGTAQPHGADQHPFDDPAAGAFARARRAAILISPQRIMEEYHAAYTLFPMQEKRGRRVHLPYEREERDGQ